MRGRFRKGSATRTEEPLQAALREVTEELGSCPVGTAVALAPVRQPAGKLVLAWAIEAHFDPASLRSNTFSMEWPPKSGRQQSFPEVDRAGWFDVDEARRKMLTGQLPLLDQLVTLTRNPPRCVTLSHAASAGGSSRDRDENGAGG